MSSTSNKDPWRCRFCYRLNKMNALRCGTCDRKWHLCVDHTYVHGGKDKQTKQTWSNSTWSYTGSQHADQEWHPPARKDGKSPRPRKGKSPRRKKNRDGEETLIPELDPPWNSKQAINAAETASSSTGSGTAENQLQYLVTELKKKDKPISPEDIQQLLTETTTPVVTSKSMHHAVTKLDQARAKHHAAMKARKNLHDQWSKYLEMSIKRWKGFAEDFRSKDKDLADKVSQTKELLQEARTHLDETKELHTKQDADALEVEILSDVDEETMKVEAAELIQQGIETIISSLDAVRVRPELSAEDMAQNKKARIEGGPGSGALQPFSKPGKQTS